MSLPSLGMFKHREQLRELVLKIPKVTVEEAQCQSHLLDEPKVTGLRAPDFRNAEASGRASRCPLLEALLRPNSSTLLLAARLLGGDVTCST